MKNTKNVKKTMKKPDRNVQLRYRQKSVLGVYTFSSTFGARKPSIWSAQFSFFLIDLTVYCRRSPKESSSSDDSSSTSLAGLTPFSTWLSRNWLTLDCFFMGVVLAASCGPPCISLLLLLPNILAERPLADTAGMSTFFPTLAFHRSHPVIGLRCDFGRICRARKNENIREKRKRSKIRMHKCTSSVAKSKCPREISSRPIAL